MNLWVIHSQTREFDNAPAKHFSVSHCSFKVESAQTRAGGATANKVSNGTHTSSKETSGILWGYIFSACTFTFFETHLLHRTSLSPPLPPELSRKWHSCIKHIQMSPGRQYVTIYLRLYFNVLLHWCMSMTLHTSVLQPCEVTIYCYFNKLQYLPLILNFHMHYHNLHPICCPSFLQGVSIDNFWDDLPQSEVNTEHGGKSHRLHVRFYVFTAMTIKGATIWDVMP
jgi:hypothetical protein